MLQFHIYNVIKTISGSDIFASSISISSHMAIPWIAFLWRLLLLGLWSMNWTDLTFPLSNPLSLQLNSCVKFQVSLLAMKRFKLHFDTYIFEKACFAVNKKYIYFLFHMTNLVAKNPENVFLQSITIFCILRNLFF